MERRAFKEKNQNTLYTTKKRGCIYSLMNGCHIQDIMNGSWYNIDSTQNMSFNNICEGSLPQLAN